MMARTLNLFLSCEMCVCVCVYVCFCVCAHVFVRVWVFVFVSQRVSVCERVCVGDASSHKPSPHYVAPQSLLSDLMLFFSSCNKTVQAVNSTK
jgi:hypothetical protein